jgi:hypothetical protein
LQSLEWKLKESQAQAAQLAKENLELTLELEKLKDQHNHLCGKSLENVPMSELEKLEQILSNALKSIGQRKASYTNYFIRLCFFISDEDSEGSTEAGRGEIAVQDM